MVFSKVVSDAAAVFNNTATLGLDLRARKVQMVYENTPPALLINFVSTVLATLIIYFLLSKDLVMFWTGGMLCVLNCRYLIWRRFSQSEVRIERAFGKWERAMLLTLILNGTWWGVFGIFTFLYSEPLVFWFSGFVLGGLIAGAIATLGAFLPAYLCYTLPVVLCSVAVLAWKGTGAGYIMAALTCTIAVSMLVTVSKVNRILSSNIILTLKNENLIKSLIDANSRLSATNANLEFEIEERIRAEKQIEFMATHDVLTGLANRRLQEDRFTRAAARATRNGHRLALLFIDLDYFKTVNDTLGHPVGDRVLQIVAGRLKDCLRTGESVCRQGGDEFLLMAEIDKVSESETIAARIIASLSVPMKLADIDIRVGASIGISLYPDNGVQFSGLVTMADHALYTAKREGKGRYSLFAGKALAETGQVVEA